MVARTLLVSLVLSLTPSAWATVDLRNGNFNTSFIDLSLGEPGIDLALTRVYNSKSSFVGLFGRSWCTEFETKIEILPEGQLRLVDCGGGLESVYTPRDFKTQNVARIVDGILDRYLKESSTLLDKTKQTIRTNLMTNAKMRIDWARRYGLKFAPPGRGEVYHSVREAGEQISFDGSHFLRKLADGTMQKFEKDGRLVYILGTHHSSLTLTYSQNGLASIQDGRNRRVDFKKNTAGFVSEIVGPNGLGATYKYASDQLVEFKNMWKNTYRLEYSMSGQLTQIHYPDETDQRIVYDQTTKRVKETWGRPEKGLKSHCKETFEYVDETSPGLSKERTATRRICDDKILAGGDVEYLYQLRKDGSRGLTHIVSTLADQKVDSTYPLEGGGPELLVRNGKKAQFTYYPTGLVKERRLDKERTTYVYDKQSAKPILVKKTVLSSNGREVFSDEFRFKYDQDQNVVLAHHGVRDRLTFTYDPSGHMTTIKDQDNVELKVQYDSKLNKPVALKAGGQRSLVVSYGQDGEISEVKTSNGNTSEAFIGQHLLEIDQLLSKADTPFNF